MTGKQHECIESFIMTQAPSLTSFFCEIKIKNYNNFKESIYEEYVEN